jgi:hypothetical protein
VPGRRVSGRRVSGRYDAGQRAADTEPGRRHQHDGGGQQRCGGTGGTGTGMCSRIDTRG